MPYIAVADFRRGMDRRRQRIAGEPGSLWTLKNGHLTRGGDVERPKKFVSTYTLPAGTFGMASVNDVLYVFGSVADPGVPVGVTYQRLQHPDSSTAMTDVLDVQSFDGKLYVAAEFTSEVFHYYDGAIVKDWIAGVVRAHMTNNDGIATHLASLFSGDTSYGATSAGAVVTVTGVAKLPFTIETTATNKTGGTDNQTLTAATTQIAVADVAEVLSTASFQIVGGSASAGVNKVTSITANAVEIMGVGIDWTSSNAVTAANVAAQINNFASTPNYSATASGNTVTISAAAGSGVGPNGFVLQVTAAGNVLVANGSFTITGGTASAGVNKISSITVNAVEILSVAVDWATSHSATATAVAAQINAFASSPEYIAFAEGPIVRISPTVSASSGSTLTLSVTVGGDVTVGSTVHVSPTATAFSGGVVASTGQPQISTLTVGGTFEAGDKFSISLTTGAVTKIFGYEAQPTPVGEILLTFKSKMHAAVDATVNFSAVAKAIRWNRDDPDNAGAGFINAASQDEGAQAVTGLAIYQGQMAVFARQSIQIWSIDADPDLNVFLQTLRDTGTPSHRSVRSYGNNDVFYLDDTGIRSIKARDSSNAAFVSDVGVAIDPFVVDYMATLTDAEIAAAVSTVDPIDGRFWLAVKDRVFVLSHFPGAKISGWSYYEPGYAISAFARVGKRVYARSGNTIYLYGGAAGTTYPSDNEMIVTMETPFYAGGQPGTFKNFEGFDVAVTNEWLVQLLLNPNDETVLATVGTINAITYTRPRIAMPANTTHVAVKMTCSKAGAATVSSMALHYEDSHEAG